MSGHSNSAYRPDIDGLRAVSVVMVCLYHAKLAFPGGFIGVDVFFVISGYLITNLILKHQQKGNFSLVDFWSRRIRRIVPAAICMTLFTLVAGYFTLFPWAYRRLAQSAVAHQCLVANFFFNKYTGYFGDAVDEMPLLHTWSLAVEEQFYLFYPLLLVAIAAWRKKLAALLLGAIALVSFGLSLHGTQHQPSATFYLLPTRVWELLMGAMICYIPVTRVSSGRLSQCLSVFGFGLILCPALLYDAQTRFPGLAALPPCLGAALLIYSNNQERNAIGSLLSLRPFVFVGLISYSLYLWHWPLYVLLKQYYGDSLSNLQLAAYCVVSFVVSYASWRWIELPFRQERSAVVQRRVITGLCCGGPVTIGAAVFIWFFQGFPERMPPAGRPFTEAVSSKSHLHSLQLSQASNGEYPVYGDLNGARKCLVWGDSHAMALMPGIEEVCKQKGYRVFQATHAATPPLVDFVTTHTAGLNENTPVFAEKVLEFVKTEKIEVAILAGAWPIYVVNDSFERQLRQTLAELNKLGTRVILVIDVPIQNTVPHELARQVFWGEEPVDRGVPMEKYLETHGTVNEMLRRAAAEYSNVEAVDPLPYMTKNDNVWYGYLDGEVLYRDSNHLSVAGGRRLAPMFQKTLR